MGEKVEKTETISQTAAIEVSKVSRQSGQVIGKFTAGKLHGCGMGAVGINVFEITPGHSIIVHTDKDKFDHMS